MSSLQSSASSVPSLAGRCVAITGGGGYVGKRLAMALLQGPHAARAVILFDMAFAEAAAGDDRVRHVQGDITNAAAVSEAVRGADAIIHIAAFGMSGSAQLMGERVHAINVQGTKHVIAAAQQHGITRLVHVSTYNVVFNGQTVVSGDETLPYVPEEQHVDHYSRTKMLAEVLVLQANGVGNVATVALRPAAIYGEGETRHFPRITKIFNAGLDAMAIGHPGILCDWLYVDNLVHALLLACHAISSPKAPAAGRAFFIADGAPVNNFTFMQQVYATRDICWLYFPTWLMYSCGFLCEMIHIASSPIYPIPPFLTRAEVCKVGCTHYMRMDQARDVLGYTPIVAPEEATRRTSAFFAPQLHSRAARLASLLWKLMLLALVVALLTGMLW